MTVWIESPFDNLPHEGFRKQRFWLMAEAFARRGHRVVYWTGDFNHVAKSSRRFVAPVAADGIALEVFPVAPYRRNVGFDRIASHRAYAREWLRRAEAKGRGARPDAIIASCPTIGAAEAAVKLAKMFSAAVAIDIMDAWPETFERLAPRFLRPLAKLALTGLGRRVGKVYREADLVSGVSERYRRLSGREDFFLAYHGIETPSVPCAARVADGTLRLVYAGNLGVGYDLGTVIEGVRMLRESGHEVRLEIAGKGPLEARWRRLAGSETVFHGYIGSRELAELMSRCDAGVIPLKDESWVGLPYKLGDYAAAGLPVLTSLGGECAELAERFRAGLRYRPGDAKSFADAVRALASGGTDPQGPASLAEMLSAGRIYDGYVDVVESVVAAVAGRGRGKNGQTVEPGPENHIKNLCFKSSE